MYVRFLSHAVLFGTLAFSLAILPAPATASGEGDTAFTVWAVVFNAPNQCSEGVCDEDDVSVDPVTPQTAVIYLTGERVQSNGRASFAASLGVGSSVGAVPGFGATELLDPTGAEIHLILRTHGRVLPELLSKQVSSMNGGCPPNTCEDLQFAAHPPFVADENGRSDTTVHRFSDGSAVKDASSVLWRTADGIIAVVNTKLK